MRSICCHVFSNAGRNVSSCGVVEAVVQLYDDPTEEMSFLMISVTYTCPEESAVTDEDLEAGFVAFKSALKTGTVPRNGEPL